MVDKKGKDMGNNGKMKEYVLKKAHDNDIKFIRLWFTDVQGILKSFALTVEELETALEEGMGFDGSSIEGFSRIEVLKRGWGLMVPL